MRPAPDIRSDIWYPASRLAGYLAKSVYGASLMFIHRNPVRMRWELNFENIHEVLASKFSFKARSSEVLQERLLYACCFFTMMDKEMFF
jgi:hypothetical protein